VQISYVTYTEATQAIIAAARKRRSTVVAPTSVHGLTLAVRDAAFRRLLNSFEILPPDGQPVRWGLNLLHQLHLTSRVYGPQLMLDVCRAAADDGLPVYLYGGRLVTLERLVPRLSQLAPGLRIAGYRSPPFRSSTAEEDANDVQAVQASGARIVFVALGCPRQEHWAHAHRTQLPVPIVCVGAAFDFHAGTLRQAPPWMQARGLEWLFRVIVEPRRLWRRYVTIVPFYLLLLAREVIRVRVLRRRSS
jgi:exopolysaccharide biosynthesis WecB/TagA/CpsF family protein